jgi:branched-subunit amino acid aminotransferase/4-amino-4-deoxychorismate lyase
VISCEYKRFLPKIKTLNYLEPLRIQSLRDDEGAQEIVYINNGNILECSTSNIFIIKNGVIITAYKDIFLGTTRNLVLKIAEKNNFKIEERVVKVEEFLSADEIFLTATYKKVIPVTKVDNRIIKEGKVGEITRQLMFLLDEFIENYS